MELSVGMKNTVEVTVTENLTAAVAKSGGLPVYATPFMIALMEEASAGLIGLMYSSLNKNGQIMHFMN